jgi:hypothetical protein
MEPAVSFVFAMGCVTFATICEKSS